MHGTVMIGRLDPTMSTKDLDLTMPARSSRAQPGRLRSGREDGEGGEDSIG